MMQPMMAQPLEIGLEKHARQWKRVQDTYRMEPKLDGMRLLLDFDDQGMLRNAVTRSGRSVIEHVQNVWADFESHPQLADLWLDCEFGYTTWPTRGLPIIDFNKTMRVMGSGPDVAGDKAAALGELPIAHVFDVVLPDQSQAWRRGFLEGLFERLDSNVLRLVRQVAEPGWHESIYETYVNMGGEGMMLKNPAAPYIIGGRPTQTWYKVKKFHTIDVVITGYQSGQGKYEGQVGAVIFGLRHEGEKVITTIGQCSGMTDEMRRHITDNFPSLLGTVIEIKYFGYTAGTPRHPQFVRLRPDKEAHECTMSQLK